MEAWRKAVFALVLAVMLVSLAPATACAAAAWLRADTPHFVVCSRTSARTLNDYAATLEDFDSLLRTYHNVSLTEPVFNKLEIYLVENTEEFRRVVPQAPAAAQGVYMITDQDMFIVAIRQTGQFGKDATKGDDVVLHEYVHHFLTQYFPGA